MALNGTAGIDDQARGELGRLGFRHEGIDGFPGYRAVGIKELALDGAQASLPLFCHQVNTRVRAIVIRPFLPQPHLGKAVPQNARITGQGGLHQTFKGPPHTNIIGGTVAQNS